MNTLMTWCGSEIINFGSGSGSYFPVNYGSGSDFQVISDPDPGKAKISDPGGSGSATLH